MPVKEKVVVNELAGKNVGDFVDLTDGKYPLNVYEYHVENFKVVAKYNASTDDQQLNFDSALFPKEEVAAV